MGSGSPGVMIVAASLSAGNLLRTAARMCQTEPLDRAGNFAHGIAEDAPAVTIVFLLDPWWNPAVEAQAIDRTHRIGQTRTVIAYRLLTEGTVEERIWELQQRKSALAKDLLGEESFARSLSRTDLEWLLSPPAEVEE